MKHSKRILAVAGLAAALTASALAQDAGRDARRGEDNQGRNTAAWQSQRDHDRDGGQARRDNDSRDRAVWNQGARDDHDRAVRNDRDDRNRAVWQNRDGDRDDRNGGYYGYPNGPSRRVYGNPGYPVYGSGGYGSPGYPVYGNGGYGYGNPEQIGYNDGIRECQNDRITGHSFRPTYSGNYKRANDGYVSGMDRNSYVQQYRDGYMRGYQEGYQGGGYRR